LSNRCPHPGRGFLSAITDEPGKQLDIEYGWQVRDVSAKRVIGHAPVRKVALGALVRQRDHVMAVPADTPGR
jgi:hypothetical protein